MANVKITDLTAATALGGTELFETVQSGASVKASAQQIKTYVGSSLNITGGVLGSVTISNSVGSFNSITITNGTISSVSISNSVGSFNSVTINNGTISSVIISNSVGSFNSITVNNGTISSVTISSVTISSSSLGSVTINNGVGNFSSLAITTGAIPFNAITNIAVGQFESHVDQTATSANVGYVVQMNNAAGFNSGITIASSTNVTVAATGIYSVNASMQFANSDTTNHTSTFWFRKNGTNIPNSASIISVPKAADGGKTLGQVTILDSITVSSYIQLVWSVSNVAVTLDYSSATATAPEVPSVIFNMYRVK
jgi:hypothetical protein